MANKIALSYIHRVYWKVENVPMKPEGKARVRGWDLIQTPLYPKESLSFKGHREHYFYTQI